MKIPHIISEGIGWCGMVLILTAYMLNNFGLLSSASVLYQVLNITGSIGILYIALQKKDWQPAVLNIIWALIAMITLSNILL